MLPSLAAPAWEFIHPRCARRRREDIEEVEAMIEAGEPDPLWPPPVPSPGAGGPTAAAAVGGGGGGENRNEVIYCLDPREREREVGR